MEQCATRQQENVHPAANKIGTNLHVNMAALWKHRTVPSVYLSKTITINLNLVIVRFVVTATTDHLTLKRVAFAIHALITNATDRTDCVCRDVSPVGL